MDSQMLPIFTYFRIADRLPSQHQWAALPRHVRKGHVRKGLGLCTGNRRSGRHYFFKFSFKFLAT
jgi:hypothetical protein